MVFFPFAWSLSEQDDGSKRQKSRSRRRRNSTKKNTVEIAWRHAQVGSSGTRADPTAWCRRHNEWRSVGRGMGNYADGTSWAQRPAKGHGMWGRCWGPSAISVENASCTAEAIVGGGVKDRIARMSTGMIWKVRAKFHHCSSRVCCAFSRAFFCAQIAVKLCS